MLNHLLHLLKKISLRLCRLRGILLAQTLAGAGPNIRIHKGARVLNPACVKLGGAVHIFPNALIDAKHSPAGSIAIEIGKNVMLREFSILRAHRGRLDIGDNSFIGPHCLLQGPNLSIGSNVMIGAGAKIFSSNHNFDKKDVPIMLQDEISKGIKIEDDAWVGANVAILDGVTIGKGSVIGAGAVVTKNVAPFSIAAGNPARLLRKRFND